MAINPATNAAILAAINTLQAGPGIPATMTMEALAGACQFVNATCRVVTLQEIISELEHIIKPHAIKEATWPGIRWGYLQAEIEALS